jgi:hypothetical protein
MTIDVLINTQNVHGRVGDALAGDLIWGVKALAIEIARTERQTFHLLEIKSIPARKIGGRWVASRAALRQHFGLTLRGPAT